MSSNRGCRLVCIGGGTGISAILRGLKAFAKPGDFEDRPRIQTLSAIVCVSDDGGSSGALIRDYDTIPPGDIRNCLLALADDEIEPLLSALFKYRFKQDEDAGVLAGHSAGNLILIALTQISGGDARKAIQLVSRILPVAGRIYPVTFERVTLCARLADGTLIEGESKIGNRKNFSPIDRIYLGMEGDAHEEYSPEPNRDALEAIKNADAVILGPGSLFTSLIANLVIPEISDAIKNVQKKGTHVIYISNIMTEPGETNNFGLTDHVRTIRNRSGIVPDIVLANSARIPQQFFVQYATEKLRHEYIGIRASLDHEIERLESDSTEEADLILNVEEYAGKLVALAEDIRSISDRRIQVLHDPNNGPTTEENPRIHTEDLLAIATIRDGDAEKTVVRHDPDKLAAALLNLVENR